MIVVTYWADVRDKPPVRIEIDESRDPFAVLAQVANRMWPGRKPRADEKHDQVMAARDARVADESAVPPLDQALSPAGEARISQGADRATTTSPPAPPVSGNAPSAPRAAGGDSTTTSPLTLAARDDGERPIVVEKSAAVGEDAAPGAPRAGVRDTSMKAYYSLRYSGRLTVQQSKVFAVWERAPAALFTRQEIARDTGLGINAVCGRVNEMLAEPLNALVEVGKKVCSVTKNEVNGLGLATEHPRGGNV